MFRIKCLPGWWVDDRVLLIVHRHRNNHKTHLSEKYGVLLLLIHVVQATTWFPEWASLDRGYGHMQIDREMQGRDRQDASCIPCRVRID